MITYTDIPRPTVRRVVEMLVYEAYRRSRNGEERRAARKVVGAAGRLQALIRKGLGHTEVVNEMYKRPTSIRGGEN